MASVRLDNLNDPRFKLLGKLLRKSRFDAIGRMAEVYSYCTDRETHQISKAMLNVITECKNFSKFVIESGLGDEIGDEVRIKGTEGRIEWLRNLRINGRKGGRPRKQENNQMVTQMVTQMDNQKVNQTETRTEPPSNPLTLTKEEKNIYIPGKAETEEPVKKPRKPKPNYKFDFESLYKKYPRKDGKSDGLKICEKQIKTQEQFDEISKAIDAYIAYLIRGEKEPEFFMYFSTFMGGRWKDYLDPDVGESSLPTSGGDITQAISALFNQEYTDESPRMGS